MTRGWLALLMTIVGLAASTAIAGPQESKTTRAALTPQAGRLPAPGFALEDATGKRIRLSDYRGRVVLLDFWATTCGGCIEEIPMFIDVAAAYTARGVAFLGVSEDIAYESLPGAREAWQRVRPFIRQRNITYPILMGDSRVTADYKIQALPLTYLLDAAGRIAATYVGIVNRANLEANLNTLLAELR